MSHWSWREYFLQHEGCSQNICGSTTCTWIYGGMFNSMSLILYMKTNIEVKTYSVSKWGSEIRDTGIDPERSLLLRSLTIWSKPIKKEKKNSQKSHTTLSLECSEYIELRRTQRKEYVKPLKKKKFAHLVFNYFFFCWTTESEHQTSKYNHYISSKSDWLQWVVPKLTDLRIQPICLKYRIFQKSRMRSHASLKTGNAKKKYNLTYGLV